MTAEQERLHERKNLMIYLDVLQAKGDMLLGHCVDISMSGIMVVTKKQYSPGDRLDVRLALPETGGFPTGPVKLLLDVRWSGRDVNPDYRIFGAHFVEPSSRAQKVIGQLLDYHGFSRNREISMSGIVIDVKEE